MSRLCDTSDSELDHDVSASDLSQELKGLEALEFQMARNFETLKEHREHDKFSGTLKGKIFNWGGQLFAIYCVFRVISVSCHIIFEDNVLFDILLV